MSKQRRRINKVDLALAKELNTVWSFNKANGMEERQAYENACRSMGLEYFEGEHLLELIGAQVPAPLDNGYQFKMAIVDEGAGASDELWRELSDRLNPNNRSG